MDVDNALRWSKRLNKYGKMRNEWFYYPSYHPLQDEWFVMKRKKDAEVHVAVFTDGRLSIFEKDDLI